MCKGHRSGTGVCEGHRGVRGTELAQVCVRGTELAQVCVRGKELAQVCVRGKELAQVCVRGKELAQVCVRGKELAQVCVRGKELAQVCVRGKELAQVYVRGTELAQGSSDRVGKEATDPTNSNGKKPNKRQQLKKVFKEYGAVAVSFHVGISLVSLGLFYVIVSSGLDITSLLLKIGFSEAVVQSKMAAGTSTFVLAYAIHKLFAPVRISITIVSVPFIVR
ncbi:protein FAM210B, mitochondrial isoform X3 [Ascaphus truei]